MTGHLAIFGVDPGKVTGLCYLHAMPSNNVFLVAQQEVSHEDVSYVLGGWVVGTLNSGMERVIGCERFTSGQQAAKQTSQPHAERVVGIVQDLGKTMTTDVYLQGPDEAKALVTDAVLRRLGWYPRGQPHAADGTRHALVALHRVRASVADPLLYGGDG